MFASYALPSDEEKLLLISFSIVLFLTSLPSQAALTFEGILTFVNKTEKQKYLWSLFFRVSLSTQKTLIDSMDFMLGGLSGCCAGFFANTFDVSSNLAENLQKSFIKFVRETFPGDENTATASR